MASLAQVVKPTLMRNGFG